MPNYIYISFMISFTSVISFLFITVTVAILSLIERKILATFQSRTGPDNTVTGLLNSLYDSLKLILKTQPGEKFFSPISSSAPLFSLILLFLTTLCLNLNNSRYNINLRILLFIVLVSIGAYTTLLIGINITSKFTILGALRAFAQTISYEIRIFLVLLITLFYTNTLRFRDISFINQNNLIAISMPIEFICWVTCILAELHRPPFDFREGESELVSGFNTEYGGINFILIFLQEYSMLIIIASTTVCLFLSGWNSIIFCLKTSLFCFTVIVIRGVTPRLRFDKLIFIAWTVLLPSILLLFSINLIF